MSIPDRADLIWPLFSRTSAASRLARPGSCSARGSNEHSSLAIVGPITSRERGRLTEVRLPPGLPVSGVVLVDHIRSIDREARKLETIGHAPEAVLEEINARLAPLLSL